MQAQQKALYAYAQEPDSPTRLQKSAWAEWKKLVQSLRLALESEASASQLRQLLNECMALYRTTCLVPPATDDLLASISGRNSSQLEAAFMWVGDWRPSSAITLVYSKMGVCVGKSDGLASSITPSCMLSIAQLSTMEVLREETSRAEAELSSSLASIQMLLADQNMAEAFGIGTPPSGIQALSSNSEAVGVQHLMDSKLASLRTLYMQANGLRLQTLQELQNLLTPIQAAQCVVAAFELSYALKNLEDAPALKRSDQSDLVRKESSEHPA
ncbi:hypothetical protein L7F22_014819 [Adiantum nelumboides]|nr:hypothetical protein [Adiantum nelumboides]